MYIISLRYMGKSFNMKNNSCEERIENDIIYNKQNNYRKNAKNELKKLKKKRLLF